MMKKMCKLQFVGLLAPQAHTFSRGEGGLNLYARTNSRRMWNTGRTVGLAPMFRLLTGNTLEKVCKSSYIEGFSPAFHFRFGRFAFLSTFSPGEGTAATPQTPP